MKNGKQHGTKRQQDRNIPHELFHWYSKSKNLEKEQESLASHFSALSLRHLRVQQSRLQDRILRLLREFSEPNFPLLRFNHCRESA
ncbi:MAG: hypothetical protein AAF570_19245, partial [Bacteroidota bacterium]